MVKNQYLLLKHKLILYKKNILYTYISEKTIFIYYILVTIFIDFNNQIHNYFFNTRYSNDKENKKKRVFSFHTAS